VPVAGREKRKVPVARSEGGKVPVARRDAGQTATTAICLCGEKAAAEKDQRKRDSNNQFFVHFDLLKIPNCVKCRV